MMPINQTNLPILLVLQGGEFFAGQIPAPFLFGTAGGIVRPENLSLTRPSAGTVVHTAGHGSAFLDDFGPAPGSLTLQGSTGYDVPTGFAGLAAFKALELLLQEYLDRRKRTADAGIDPDTVNLFYFDILNAEAFLIYPATFTLDRNKRGPLMYFYRMQFHLLRDLLHDVALPAILDTLGNQLSNLGEIATRLAGLGQSFAEAA